MPFIPAWVKEADNFTAHRFYRSNVAAFVTIAGKASVGQIIFLSKPAVFFTHNMVYFMAKQSVVAMYQTILTQTSRTFNHLAPQIRIDICGTRRLLARQKLPGAGFGEAHQVFKLHCMIEFCCFVCGQAN